jgi:hypothetical protein
MSGRGFPSPWSVEELNDCFVVRDANGQALDHFFYEEDHGRRSAAKQLSKDEARRTTHGSHGGTRRGWLAAATLRATAMGKVRTRGLAH